LWYIVGVVSTGEDATGLILEGLQILRNRGYDSCGIATVSKDMDASDDEHEMTKYLINLEEEIPIATR
jgi:glucosamine 6-phosphate synthetase-like amidotransferase/phosphosugar isomerase protein